MRRTHLAVLALALTVLVSCGKKNRAPITTNGNIPGAPGYSIQDAAFINNYKARIPCVQNQGRRVPDITFNTAGGTSTATRTTIFGQFQPGVLGGNISKIFIGASTFGDIITVSKVTNGPAVVGYNVSFSFCNYSPLIRNDRGISNLLTSGIIVDDDANCGVGRVDYAYTRLTADSFTLNQGGFPVNYSAYPFDTVFTKTACQ